MTGSSARATTSNRGGIHADWFARLRVGLLLGQILVIGLAQATLPLKLPLAELGGLLGVMALSSVALSLWRRRHPATEGLLALVMVADVAALTGMLYLTGGPANPFSSLYLVYVAWAAVVLSPRATWTVSVLAFFGFGLLFFEHRALVMTMPAHDHGHHWHLRGMWLSFGLAAALIVYFVQRLNRAVSRRDRDVARLEAAQGRAEHLASLATLAAGAAHELATPLSTIAVVAKELERGLADDPERAGATEDARLVRSQVQRCRDILDQMSAEAGEAAGEPAVEIDAPGFAEAVLAPLAPEPRSRVRVEAPPGLGLGALPLRAVARGVRGLVMNGLHASEPPAPVALRVRVEGTAVLVDVTDEGVGMDDAALARLGEPFHTTKGPGQGMGLGVFLMRTVAERLGGELEHVSRVGAGTTATLRLPLAGPRRSVA